MKKTHVFLVRERFCKKYPPVDWTINDANYFVNKIIDVATRVKQHVVLRLREHVIFKHATNSRIKLGLSGKVQHGRML